MIVYLDTSAVLKLIIREGESEAMRAEFSSWQAEGSDLVSSYLLFTELHCAAVRRGLDGSDALDRILTGIGLIDMERSQLVEAARDPRGLRSADAIHLAVARAVEAELMVTYDAELAEVARATGLPVSSPGRGSAIPAPSARR